MSLEAEIAYWRSREDSQHILAIEGALTDAWQTTAQVAARTGRSAKFARLALHYLAAMGRASHRPGQKTGRGYWYEPDLWTRPR